MAGCGATTGLLPALVAAAWTAMAAASPGGVVRNQDPERPAASGSGSMPIYFPLEPRRAPGDTRQVLPEDLLRQFMHEHTSMRYGDAVETAMRLADAVPDRPIGHYNLACALARLDRVDEALVSLERAIECGWRNAAHMEIDPDLRVVRRTDAYAQLRRRLDALAAREQGPVGPLRDDPWPDVAEDLTREIPALLERYHVPGVAVALVSDGAVVWKAGFGRADDQTGAPMSPDRRFSAYGPVHLGAVAAAIQLDGRRQLPLGKLIAAAREMRRLERMAAGQPAPVSLASLPAEFAGAAGVRRDDAGREPVIDIRADIWMHELLVAAIGATGRDYRDHCRQEILEPLRMTATEFAGSKRPPDLVTGHTLLGSPVHAPHAPSGAMLTTVGDVARLLIAMTEASEPAQLPQVPFERVRAFAAAAPLGPHCRMLHGSHGPVLELTESAGGVGLMARLYVESRRGVVVMFNAESGPALGERIGRLALGGSPAAVPSVPSSAP